MLQHRVVEFSIRRRRTVVQEDAKTFSIKMVSGENGPTFAGLGLRSKRHLVKMARERMC